MSKTVIKVEGISKQYRLGTVSTGTIHHDLNRWWCKLRGKEDPYLTVIETNDRTKKGSSDYIWALKDVNFEVKQGEVLGIIGRNGAGKSTLLKILSRTTAPTSGKIKVRGRVASLLEVGTGFHPELTGRENVYLNGAILGMTRAEINKKFDEIVDFAGVERYIDTPVKRYSSGMYVRLAFAVAAHLEPDILIVDEVLAVGDAEFQKKALGKMKDVSFTYGRTVLLVSHNMLAIKNLCSKVLYFQNGKINEFGDPEKILNNYNSNIQGNSNSKFWHHDDLPGNDIASLLSIEIINPVRKYVNYIEDEIQIQCNILIKKDNSSVNISLAFFDTNDFYIVSAPCLERGPYNTGVLQTTCKIPANFFNQGRFYVTVILVGPDFKIIAQLDKVILLEYIEEGSNRKGYYGYWGGAVRPNFSWQNFVR